MQRKSTRADFWTDIIIVGGVVAALSVASTSAFFHWLDTHRSSAVERITKIYGANRWEPTGDARVSLEIDKGERDHDVSRRSQQSEAA
jgi:hypothetical protein